MDRDASGWQCISARAQTFLNENFGLIKTQHILASVKQQVWFYATIFCIGVLASCSNDNVVEIDSVDEEEISFGNTLADEEAVTRATGSEAAELLKKKFYVYGYKTKSDGTQIVFPGYEVDYDGSANTTATNTSGWEYVGKGSNQLIKYWDAGATEYRFYGISPVVDNTASPATSNPTISDDQQKFSIAVDASNVEAAPYFSDLWYTNDVASCVKKPVTLVFRKPFCKVRIMLIDEEGNQYTNTKVLKKETLSFAPTTTSDGSLIKKGTFTLTYPTSGDSKEFSFSTTANDDAKYDAITEPFEEKDKLYFATEQEKWYTLVPPTQSSQGTYSMKAKIGGKDKEAVVPAEFMNWKPGYAYTYIFKILNDGVYLVDVDEVMIKTWVDKTTDYELWNW